MAIFIVVKILQNTIGFEFENVSNELNFVDYGFCRPKNPMIALWQIFVNTEITEVHIIHNNY